MVVTARTVLALLVLSVGCEETNVPARAPELPSAESSAGTPAGAPPPDQPVRAQGRAQVESLEAALAPYIAQGRRTYPEARERYLAGLPPAHRFYVVTKVRDESGRFEQIFVSVERIEDERIHGRIASDITVVRGYRNGDAYALPESELIDWVIVRPDGSEEGNVVGKFLDQLQGR